MHASQRILATFIGIGLAVGVGLTLFGLSTRRYQLVVLGPEYNPHTFTLELATPENAQRGLRGRASLAADAGMLVRLPKPAVLAYSTRATAFPLDVLFFDADQNIIDIVELQANDENLTAANSRMPVSGAILLHGGAVRRAGILTGMHLDLGRPPRRTGDGND